MILRKRFNLGKHGAKDVAVQSPRNATEINYLKESVRERPALLLLCFVCCNPSGFPRCFFTHCEKFGWKHRSVQLKRAAVTSDSPANFHTTISLADGCFSMVHFGSLAYLTEDAWGKSLRKWLLGGLATGRDEK